MKRPFLSGDPIADANAHLTWLDSLPDEDERKKCWACDNKANKKASDGTDLCDECFERELNDRTNIGTFIVGVLMAVYLVVS